MSKRAMLSRTALVVTGLVAGCANPWQPPAYETAIKRYYEAHASERGYCLAPYIDGFTKVQVVEDTPERMVVEARYLYRDWLKDGSGARDGMMLGCVSYGARSFVLTHSDDRYEVVEMSGPRRN